MGNKNGNRSLGNRSRQTDGVARPPVHGVKHRQKHHEAVAKEEEREQDAAAPASQAPASHVSQASATTQKPWLIGYRWRKGQASPNPKGRPKANRPMTQAYLQALDCILPPDVCAKLGLKVGSDIRAGIARALCIQAVNGNVKAAQEVTDRVQGRATEEVKLIGDPRQQVNILVQYGDTRAKLFSKLGVPYSPTESDKLLLATPPATKEKQ